ncbi:unnamed protein product [Paramecium octaurelia]|uniref:Uncharacterized protein n=1 Tax=Paramecium octaurelia TaxID=43137 RepID=A0A8S1U9S3_PAROT|nr:unnamed protein product [Paramecium octaurelia]
MKDGHIIKIDPIQAIQTKPKIWLNIINYKSETARRIWANQSESRKNGQHFLWIILYNLLKQI